MQNTTHFSVVGFVFGRILADNLQVPVGLILSAVGGLPMEVRIDRKTLEFEFPDVLQDWTRNDLVQDWVYERAALNIKQASNPLQRHPYKSCYLFEMGIQPFHRYPIEGIIQCQGEPNARNMEVHGRLFPLLVNGWRRNWNVDLPFYYVQLSSIDRPSWTWFGDSQCRLVQTVSNTDVVVSSDCGDPLNAHPTRKREIGKQLAHWALSKTYEHNAIPSGSLFRSAAFTGNAAYITFDYTKGLTTSDGNPIRTFEIVEREGPYYPAQVAVENGKVKVWNGQVTHPRLVRHGWQPFMRANLVNEAGISASTFRAIKE